MFGFLNTSFLFALAGVSIPLLIHLLARKKVKPLYFSSLAFLHKIQKQHFKRMQIRQILLLIMRCLAILFLVLAFARPALKSGSAVRGQSRATVVLSLDRSMSMARGNVWPDAQTALRRVIQTLQTGDRVAFPDHSEDETVFRESSSSDLMKQVGQAMPEYSRVDAESLIVSASKRFDPMDYQRTLYWITDLQKSAFNTAADSLPVYNIDHCILIPVTEEIPNTAISAGGIENQIISPGAALRFSAEVHNYSDHPAENRLIRLLLDGISVSQKVISLNAGSSQRVQFSVIPRNTGWIRGEFVLEDDHFPQDNHWYFTGFIPPEVNVWIVSARSADAMPLELALTADHSIFRIQRGLSGSRWADQIQDAQVVYLVNHPAFSERELQALSRFLEGGGGLIVIPGFETDIRQLNDRILSPHGINLGNVLGTGTENAYQSFGRMDMEHPLFENIFEPGRENVRSPEFYRIIELMQSGRGQVLIRFRNEMPFLAVLPADPGMLIVFAGGYSMPWSDLKMTPFFAPLMHRVTLYAMDQQQNKPANLCGQSVCVAVKSVVGDLSGDYVSLPSGEVKDVLPELTGRKLQMCLDRADIPGIYSFYQNDSLTALRAVNMDPKESDFTAIDPAFLRTRFPGLPVTILKPGASLEREIRESRMGHEIGWEMMLIAFLLLAGEMILARDRNKSESQSGPCVQSRGNMPGQ